MEPQAEETLPARPAMSRLILNIGFAAGLVLAVACLALSAFYLLRFQDQAGSAVSSVIGPLAKPNAGATDLMAMQAAFSAHAYMARVLLLSCGVFVGMAFGFLGFSLFLIGAEGAIDAEGKVGESTFNVTRLAPGAFVILVSAILIGVCVTRSLPVSLTAEELEPVAESATATANEQGGPEAGGPDDVDPRPPEEGEARPKA